MPIRKSMRQRPDRPRKESSLAWLDRYGYLIFAVVTVALVSAIFVGSMADGAAKPIEFATGSNLPDGTAIKVHVIGEVMKPGVYEMAAGQRVNDAITTAGGTTAAADADAFNLARRLRDGEQIVVPSRGSSPSRSAGAAAPLVPGELLNINIATTAQLDQLPGIGEAYSRRIVDSRTVDGPFKTVDDLLTRRVIPASTMESIRPLITTGP